MSRNPSSFQLEYPCIPTLGKWPPLCLPLNFAYHKSWHAQCNNHINVLSTKIVTLAHTYFYSTVNVQVLSLSDIWSFLFCSHWSQISGDPPYLHKCLWTILLTIHSRSYVSNIRTSHNTQQILCIKHTYFSQYTADPMYQTYVLLTIHSRSYVSNIRTSHNTQQILCIKHTYFSQYTADPMYQTYVLLTIHSRSYVSNIRTSHNTQQILCIKPTYFSGYPTYQICTTVW